MLVQVLKFIIHSLVLPSNQLQVHEYHYFIYTQCDAVQYYTQTMRYDDLYDLIMHSVTSYFLRLLGNLWGNYEKIQGALLGREIQWNM